MPAIDEAGLPGEADDVGIALLEVHDAGHRRPSDGEEEPVELGEGQVAVLGQRAPRVTGPDPVPLVLVPIPVADEDVEQPGLQEEPLVHPFAGFASRRSHSSTVSIRSLAPSRPGVTGAFTWGSSSR